jgi:hypothetical protein
VNLETPGQVIHCDNWYDVGTAPENGQEKAGQLPGCIKKGTTAPRNSAHYFCSFFYDHLGESLHRIKLKA